jgi:tetratricopeptide (TPR) repeat protein
MTARTLTRGFVVGACALLMGALAIQPAFAQQSSLRGRVVDEAGSPVAGATVVLETVGSYDQQFEVTTNDKGEWFKGGLAGFGGVWKLTVTKDDLSAIKNNVRAQLGQVTPVEDIVVVKGGADAAANDAANLNAEEIEKRNAETEALNKLFTDASTAFDAGDYDGAIEKVNGMIAVVENCDVCYDLLGDINVQKQDLEAAEAAYLKSIEIKPDKPAPYNSLASIYNKQRKFDEAAAMSEKASSLTAGDPVTGGGGGDASASYNQGIALWNAGKAPEAEAAFKRATELDPKMADAHYWLGMACVNQGKLKEAKTPFETYLKLEPEGENAATAKALLAQIGG